MTQLTLRGFDPELERRLRALARRNATSLNKAALQLMRRGAGLEGAGSSGQPAGGRLAKFAGRMSAAEARSIDQAIAQSRKADLALQR